MPDPFDHAKDGLSDVQPTTDLWAEASRRAASREVVELTPAASPARRGRWLAVAAAVAVVAGTVGVLSLGDDSTVDTTPSDPAGEPTIYEGEDGCSFGITGEPPTVRQFGPAEDPVSGTHFVLGDLTARVNVPVWSDSAALYRYEAVELQRGEGQMRSPDAQSTLVEWHPDRDACDSFTVTVTGGDPEVTEPAAIAFADRIVLQSELPGDEDTTTTSIFPSDDCIFSVAGEPVALAEGPSDPPLFDPAGQPEGQTIAHATLGSQRAEVHVPGVVLTDLVGERVEDIELGRGTAQVWFGPDFVQVRWFPGTEEPCDSFTVTVTGSTEDGNRHAAVDLADRLSLPTEIGVEEPPVTEDDVAALLEGDWRLESSAIDGAPTDGDGLRFTFLDGEASWTDGCNAASGQYTAVGVMAFRLGEGFTNQVLCPPNPTADAVQQVMGADTIGVAVDGELLVLSASGAVLTLRPVDSVGLTTDEQLVGMFWVLEGWRTGDGPMNLATPGRRGPLTFEFTADRVWFDDGCNDARAGVAYGATSITVDAAAVTYAGCEGDLATQAAAIDGVMDGEVEVRFTFEGQLSLTRDGTALHLRPE